MSNEGYSSPVQLVGRVKSDGTLATQYRVPVVSATAGVLTQSLLGVTIAGAALTLTGTLTAARQLTVPNRNLDLGSAVLGYAGLTTANRLPYVSAAGTIAEWSGLRKSGDDLLLVAEATSAPWGYFRNYYGDANAGGFRFQKARGTESSPAAVQQYDTLGNFQAYGYINGAFRQLASLQFVTFAAPAGNYCETIARWYLDDGASGPVHSCDLTDYGIALPAANRIVTNRIDSLAATPLDIYYGVTALLFRVGNDYTRTNGYGSWVSESANQPSNTLYNFASDTFAPWLSFRKSRGTEASPSAVQSGDLFGNLDYGAYINGAFRSNARLDVIANAAPAGNYCASKWRFQADDGSTGLVLAAEIDSGGIIMPSGKTITGGLDLQPRTFASIYVASNTTGESINNATWHKLTQFATDGETNDCTADVANDKITFTRTGMYLVYFTGSFTCAAATAWYVQGYLNGAGLNQLRGAFTTAGAADFQTGGFCGIIDVSTAPWDLDVRAYHAYGSAVTLVMREAQLSVMRIGDT